jgi:hypothetical protein
MAAEFTDGINLLQQEKKLDVLGNVSVQSVGEVKDDYVTEERQRGVRLVEVKNAGHHNQNDVQWQEMAEALRRFAQQAY